MDIKDLISKHLHKVNQSFLKYWIYHVVELGGSYIIHYKEIWDDEYLTDATYCLRDEEVIKIYELEQEEVSSKIGKILD